MKYLTKRLRSMERDRHTVMAREIAHAAGIYITRESNGTSLITVTHADVSPDFANAMIFISVIPEDQEDQALEFLKRNRTDFRTWVAKEMRFKRVPMFDFSLDIGEKNRQAVQDIH